MEGASAHIVDYDLSSTIRDSITEFESSQAKSAAARRDTTIGVFAATLGARGATPGRRIAPGLAPFHTKPATARLF